MQTRSCRSWQEFESLIANVGNLCWSLYGTELIFRGQANASWYLQSRIEREMYRYQAGGLWEQYTIQRNPSSMNYRGALNNFLTAFKTTYGNAKLPNLQLMQDVDWWCLGRHHGLFTPLLDWSTDYSVAAYFAFCEAEESSDVAIWVLLPSDRICAVANRVHSEPQDDHYLQLIRSQPHHNPRQLAQKGLFTTLNSPIFVSLEAYIDNINTGNWPALYRIVLPGALRSQVLTILNDKGITAGALKLTGSPHQDGAAINDVAGAVNHRFKEIFLSPVS